MNMKSRNQYLKEIRKEYLKTNSKKKKGELLDEAKKRTKLDRKTLIRKLASESNLDKLPSQRKQRKPEYGKDIVAKLVECWHLFDKPCGQRLESSLEYNLDKLRKEEEFNCSEEIAEKLQKMGSSTIDDKLRLQKEMERDALKYRRKKGRESLLNQKIPTKTFNEQDRNNAEFTQVDFVELCGQSASGEYIYILCSTDITHGWWEGEPQMGAGQRRTLGGLKVMRKRSPIPWTEIHPDNDKSVLNNFVYEYTRNMNLGFSRSRPYKKNDNCLVEQKNGDYVRKSVGYLRYDSEEELMIIRDLFRNELRLYKNFFQPQMKLISKERIKGKIKREYDKPKSPYRRILEDPSISKEIKKELNDVYDSLSIIELKRAIDEKLDDLCEAYEKKNNSQKVDKSKKLKPVSVTK